jgi:hypothetical protein
MLQCSPAALCHIALASTNCLLYHIAEIKWEQFVGETFVMSTTYGDIRITPQW